MTLSPDRLLDQARDAYAWTGKVTIAQGPRGALGRIWRVETGATVYALKEIFAHPPSEALVEAELAFQEAAAGAGVRFPGSHPDRRGRHLVELREGGWLRLYDWVELGPVDLSGPEAPRELGVLLARLHGCAPKTATEPDGGPPDPWYHRVTIPTEWEGRNWAAGLPEVGAMVTAPDPAELVTCHRDLHPENVLRDGEGGLVVVDWGDLGPATPSRELAKVLFDWFCDPEPDLAAMAAMYSAYISAGGPGRISRPADFSMLVATRLNFLRRQLEVAADPSTEPHEREWAGREIEESLRILPTPRRLARVLEPARRDWWPPAACGPQKQG